MRSVVLALLLAGCATVTGASRDHVVIRHDPAVDGAEDLQPMADSECARYGKRAVFVRHDLPLGIIGMRYARFDCRRPG